MSALEKLEITIADRLHDFTDKDRMPSQSDKPKIVNYIQRLLIDLFKKKIQEVANTKSLSFNEVVKSFQEDEIVTRYYPTIANESKKIENPDQLYTTSMNEFVYFEDNTDAGPISFPKQLFKYVPQWLHSLYGGDKSFMLDVTLLTEKDICNSIKPSSNKLILKSIATEYDRNIENKLIETCSSVYRPTENSILLTKIDNELLGFDTIQYMNTRKLKWKIGDTQEGIIDIDKIISAKSAGLKKDADESSMSLPLFLEFINDIFNKYIGEKNKKNTFNLLDKKIQKLYDISFSQFEEDYDSYVLCLTDLKSMGDLLQVKMAQLSNSIFVSNDRVTCLMSSKCYSNPTVRTRKTKPEGRTQPSVREIYLFDDSGVLLSDAMKEQLKQANESRQKREQEIKLKKIKFIQLIKSFLTENYMTVLTNLLTLLPETIVAYQNALKEGTDAILNENSKKRKRDNVYYFNYSIYQMYIIIINLNYYTGFLKLLVYIYNLPSDKIESFVEENDDLINYDIDSSREDQENYISLSFTYLLSNVKDLIEYLTLEDVRTSRLATNLIYNIELFDYPIQIVYKLLSQLNVFNIRSGINYETISPDNNITNYQVGIFYSAETFNRFKESIEELYEMSNAYYQTIETKMTGGRYTDNLFTISKKRTKTRRTKPTTKYTKNRNTFGSKFFNTLSFKPSFKKNILYLKKDILESNNLIDVVVYFLITYLKYLQKQNTVYTKKWKTLMTSQETYTLQQTKTFMTEFKTIKNDYSFTRMLLFQILFIVHFYDISIPILPKDVSTTPILIDYPPIDPELIKLIKSPNYMSLKTKKRKIQTFDKSTKRRRGQTVYEMPEEGGSNQKFQFSQTFISRLVDRLKL